MHSHSARHKTLPQKQKCIWGRRIWRKKLQKEKIHAKIQAVGRTAAEKAYCVKRHGRCDKKSEQRKQRLKYKYSNTYIVSHYAVSLKKPNDLTKVYHARGVLSRK